MLDILLLLYYPTSLHINLGESTFILESERGRTRLISLNDECHRIDPEIPSIPRRGESINSFFFHERDVGVTQPGFNELSIRSGEIEWEWVRIGCIV